MNVYFHNLPIVGQACHYASGSKQGQIAILL